MDEINTGALRAPIGEEQARKFTLILKDYNARLNKPRRRMVEAEEWWKLRNGDGEIRSPEAGKWRSRSGWLHNVIVSKHADAVEAYPEPNILPREKGDSAEARKLSAIVPCVLEQNHFDAAWSDAMWQKCKFGTAVYKVVWDKSKLGGLGDISIEVCNPLNVYWEAGVKDIQRSRYVFHTELVDKELLHQRYGELLEGKLKGGSWLSTKFLYDESVDTAEKATVVEVYYRKEVEGRSTLQYCKYVEDTVLFATENDPEMALRGWYDHGQYPFVFDALFPIEGSPCGYGYVDICRNPQEEIDLLKGAFVKNAMVGAIPRYFQRGDGGVNEAEFLDLTKPLVRTTGSIDENALRVIDHRTLDGVYVSVLQSTIEELRETSGNTETSTGSVSSGVTAASAIAALQEASGKGSRDSTQAAYRAFGRIVELCIELIRQFYDMPRQFRIVGDMGAEEFVSYDNANLQPQPLGMEGMYRLPVFDIKISAQKKSVYTKISQNELATQFFQMGFFNPQMTDQALMCLELMDFDGKDAVMQSVQRNGTMQQKLAQYMQLSLLLAAEARPELVAGISQDVMQTMGGAGGAAASARPMSVVQTDVLGGVQPEEHSRVDNARERSREASQPQGGRVTAQRGDK